MLLKPLDLFIVVALPLSLNKLRTILFFILIVLFEHRLIDIHTFTYTLLFDLDKLNTSYSKDKDLIFEVSHKEAVVPNVDLPKYEPLVSISLTLAPRVADDHGFPEVLHVVIFRRDKLQLGTNQDLESLKFRAA